MLDPLFVPGQRVTVEPKKEKDLPVAAVVLITKFLYLRQGGMTLGYMVRVHGSDSEVWVRETQLSARSVAA